MSDEKTAVSEEQESDATPEQPETTSEDSRSTLEQAQEIARRHACWAAGFGIIPIPAIDVAAITVIQLKMINEIAELYGARLSESLAKSILISLLTGVAATAAAYGGLSTFVKSVPVVGPLLSLATMPAAAGASTYAVGVVFATAFEKGDPSILDGGATAQAA